MRRTSFILSTAFAAALAMPAFAGGGDARRPAADFLRKRDSGGVNCIVSKKDLKEAQEALSKRA